MVQFNVIRVTKLGYNEENNLNHELIIPKHHFS
jgi:hypothetical protein